MTEKEAANLGLCEEAKRKNKYNAEKVQWRGYTFDSKREAELLIPVMQTKRFWVFHPRYRVESSPGVFEVFTLDLFWAELEFSGTVNGLYDLAHYIDVKGYETERFKRLRPLFEKQYGVKVEIWK